MSGDNIDCEVCGHEFDARNTDYEIINEKWVCGGCTTNYDDDELKEMTQ